MEAERFNRIFGIDHAIDVVEEIPDRLGPT
jgi:hypothetical protein